MRNLSVVAALALAVAACDGRSAEERAPAFAPVAAAATRMAEAAPSLLPLTEEDLSGGSRGAGCSCGFTVERGGELADLLHLYDGELIMRTKAGLRSCAVGDARNEAINAGAGSVDCGDRKISIALSDTEQGANDDTGSDARVTLEEGGRSTVLTGGWGCAC